MTKWILALISIMACFCLFAPFFLYVIAFGTSISSDMSDWSIFGEFYGGTAGTLLSSLSIGVILYSLYSQNRSQNNKDQIEMFFKILDIYRNHVDSFELQKHSGIASGDRGFRSLNGTLLSRIEKCLVTLGGEEDELSQIASEFFDERSPLLGSFFTLAYNVLKFIDTSTLPETEKKQLLAFYRATLTQAQLQLIFFNCLYGGGKDKFKNLVEKHSLLEHLDKENPSIAPLLCRFSKNAYGKV